MEKEKFMELIEKEGNEITTRLPTFKQYYRKYESHDIHCYLAGDLIDFSSEYYKHYNDSYSYILIVIDLYSKYIVTVPLKNKNVNELLRGFKEVFEHFKDPIATKEFYNEKGNERGNEEKRQQIPFQFIAFDKERALESDRFKDLLKSKNIYLYHSYSKNGVSIIESAIKDFKSKLAKHLTHRKRRFIDVVQEVTDELNNVNKVHFKVKGKRPEDIVVYKGKYKPVDINKGLLSGHVIEKPTNVPPRARANKQTLEINDLVRIRINKDNFPLKKRSLMANWSEDIFKVINVSKKCNVLGYKLKRLTHRQRTNANEIALKYELDTAEKRLWYASELLKVKMPENELNELNEVYNRIPERLIENPHYDYYKNANDDDYTIMDYFNSLN